jgi:hypothetical protein
MSNRKDIMAPRKKKDGGTYWVKIGTAWENEKGTQLVFDALPLPDNEGRVVANLFEPREPQQRQQSGGYQQQQQQNDDLGSDSIPF